MKRNKNGWIKCIKNYHFHSIFVKNLLLVMGVITLPFICVLCVSFYTYNNMREKEIKAYTDKEVTKIISQMENLLEETKMKAIMLGADENVELFIYSNEYARKVSAVNDICYFLSLYNAAIDVIDSVYVYSSFSNEVISRAGLYSYKDFYDRECIDYIEDTDEMYHFRYVDRKVLGKQKRTLSLYYRGEYGPKYKGIIIVNLDLDKLQKEFNYGDNLSVEIVRGEEVLYSEELLLHNNNNDTGSFAEQNQFVVTRPLENNMQLVIRLDVTNLYGELDSFWKYLMLFIFFMMAITVFMVFYISLKIFNPIGEILEVVEKESLFEVEEKVLLQNRDELQDILEGINSTVNSKKDVEKELVERLALLKKAQAVALQSQINPHFMNNTLETINWMAIGKLGEENDISFMLNALSSLLRKSLESTDTFVTLADEIQYAETYLFIQRKRYRESFQVIWNVPQELLDCKIVKVVLQPLIENAINYGIKPNDGEGEIKISARRDEEIVSITVWDSGLGIAPKEVEEINHSIRGNVIKENRHIGLSNVNQRIALAFGEAYGLTIFSEPNKGTSVTVVIPYRT